ncbi:hypothetical protein Tco_0123667 [Tanacetum coccineum]
MAWFSSLKPRHDDFVVEERLIWLEIEGVPIRAWNNDTFNQICSKWGEGSMGKYDQQGDKNIVENNLASVADIMDDIENVQIRWIVVYAPQNLLSKISLWSSLTNLMVNWDGILVMMGDFNEV